MTIVNSLTKFSTRWLVGSGLLSLLAGGLLFLASQSGLTTIAGAKELFSNDAEAGI